MTTRTAGSPSSPPPPSWPPGPPAWPSRSPGARVTGGATTWKEVERLVSEQKLEEALGARREDPRGGAGRGRRGERGEGARPRGPAPDRAPRLRDVGPVPEGPALAEGPAAAHDAAPLLRAVARHVRAGLRVGDRPAREGRVDGRGRPQGVDARARSRPRPCARTSRSGGTARRSGATPVERRRRVRRAEQLPEGDPRHAAGRRVVPLRRAPRRHVRLAARAVERRLRARPRRSLDRGRPRRVDGS